MPDELGKTNMPTRLFSTECNACRTLQDLQDSPRLQSFWVAVFSSCRTVVSASWMTSPSVNEKMMVESTLSPSNDTHTLW